MCSRGRGSSITLNGRLLTERFVVSRHLFSLYFPLAEPLSYGAPVLQCHLRGIGSQRCAESENFSPNCLPTAEFSSSTLHASTRALSLGLLFLFISLLKVPFCKPRGDIMGSEFALVTWSRRLGHNLPERSTPWPPASVRPEGRRQYRSGEIVLAAPCPLS